MKPLQLQNVLLLTSFVVVSEVFAWGGLFNRWNPALISDLGYTGGHGGGFGSSNDRQVSKTNGTTWNPMNNKSIYE